MQAQQTALKQTFLSYIFTVFPRSLLQNFLSDIPQCIKISTMAIWELKVKSFGWLKKWWKMQWWSEKAQEKNKCLNKKNSIEKETCAYEENVITNFLPWKRPSWRKAQKMFRIQVKVTSADAYLLNGMYMNTFHSSGLSSLKDRLRYAFLNSCVEDTIYHTPLFTINVAFRKKTKSR